MSRIIFPLVLFISISSFLYAQSPVQMRPGDRDIQPVLPVDPGSPRTGADAGVGTPVLFPSANSNDVEFLCLGDSMNIIHSGGSLLGDPNPLTTPGFNYAWYQCAPTVTGPNWTSILNDACHLIDPFSFVPPGITVVEPPFITPDGNTVFFNQGFFQAAFGGGGPYQAWFAPITVDDFANSDPEPDPITMELGPCMDVNVADAFSVVYLNEITGSNFVASGCYGTLTVEGGLPEWDGSNYSNISIVNNANPTITGMSTITSALTHGGTLTFSVPVAGTYTITLEDGVSCPMSFEADMSGCQPPVLDIGDNSDVQGATDVCVEVTVNDFVDILSLDFFLLYDPAIVSYVDVTFDAPSSFALAFSPMAGQIAVTWGSNSPSSLPDGSTLMTICFDLIGNPGSSSLVTVADGSQPGVNPPGYGAPLGDNSLMVLPGTVTILGGMLNLDFTSCSTLDVMNPGGSFSFTVSGGTPPYAYTYQHLTMPAVNGSGMVMMDGGSATESNLPPGTYSVVVNDSGTSMSTQNVTIDNAPILTPMLEGTAPSCFGTGDGAVVLNQGNFTNLGGVAPYTIDWSTGPGDMGATTLTNLNAGVYTVTVTDANGCSQTVGQGISDPPLLTIDNTTLINVSCNGNGMDGGLAVQGVGGIGPNYQYSWGGGQSTPVLTDLPPGQYCVTVTDQTNCTAEECYDITQPIPPTLTFDTNALDCPGDMTGSITANVNPGDGMITSISWSNMQMGSTITGLGPGSYTVTVLDDQGCELIDTETLTEPPGLSIAGVTITQPNCIDSNDGQIAVQAQGGTGNYSFSWSSGGTGSAEFNLGCDQTYTVTVSDGGVCPPIILDTIIPCPPIVTATFDNIVGVDCNGGLPCDGQATLTPMGGTTMSGNYFFTWDNGTNVSNQPVSTLTNLCQGINTVSVFDENACEFIFTVDIPAPPELTLNQVTSIITPVSCFEGNDGSIVADAQGGVGPYNYSWQGGPNSPDYNNLTAGDYILSITDQNQCEFQVTNPLSEPAPLVPFVVIDNSSDPSCAGEMDGVIEISWTGGNLGSTSFAWTGSSSTSFIADNLAAGMYSVTVTDSKDCTGTLDTVLNEPPPVTFDTPMIIEPECNGETGLVTLQNVMGGTGNNYTFSVDNSTRRPISQSIRVLAGTDIPVEVFDENGCSTIEFINIAEPSPVFVEFGAEIEEVDLGETTTLIPFIDADLGIDSIIWSPTTGLTCIDSTNSLFNCEAVSVDPDGTTTYTITVIDSNGCEATDEIIIEVNKRRNVYIPNAFSPDGNGRNDYFEIFLGNGIKAIPSAYVFDRWGETIMELKDIPVNGGAIQIWDGFFRGKLVNPGVFVYLIEVTFVDDITFPYRGDVTVIR